MKLSSVPAAAAPAGLFLAAWGLFLAGALPAPYGGDSGELIASAAGLGVSHAPGYPLHALLGKAAMGLLPWGAAAYRVALSSAVFSALTVLIVFRLLREALGRGPWAWAGAALYASFPVVWDQAQTAEVFALNNLFAAGLLYAAYRSLSVEKGAAWFLLWSFLYGAGLANHQTLLLLGPGFLVLYLAGLRGPSGEPRRLRAAWLVPGALAFAAGLTLYAFLALRAGKHPVVNFGDPHTWDRFWAVITRKEFGSFDLHPAAVPFRTAQVLLEQARAFVERSFETSGAFASVLGGIGLLISLRRPTPRPGEMTLKPLAPAGREARAHWLLFWLFAGPVFFLLSNLSPHNTLAQWRMERFLLLPALIAAAGAAFTLRAAARRSAWLALLLAGGLAVEQAVSAPHPWFRWNLAFRDFGRNYAASLPKDARLVIDRLVFDEPTSCLLNLVAVEGKRPDVRVIYRPGTLFELFYGEDVLELPRNRRFARQEEREAPLWKDASRPTAVFAFAKENLPPFPFGLNGLVYLDRAAPEAAAHFIRRARDARDYPTRLILVHYPYFAAKAAFESGRRDDAAREHRRALRLGADMEWLRSNLGSLWSRWAREKKETDGLKRARREFEAAAGVDPYFPTARFGVGYVDLQDGRAAAAAQSFALAARLRPDWAEAHYMLGLAFSLAGLEPQAREAWERFEALDPSSPLAAEVRKALAGR